MTDELITGSKDQPSRFDGFLKAAPGELIFTLLERDIAVERSPKHASFAERPTLAMLKAGQ